MKKLLLLCLLLAGLASCSSSKDEPAVVQEPETGTNTRFAEQYPYYYMYDGKQIRFALTDQMSYVILKAADKDAFISTMSEKGIDLSDALFYEYFNRELDSIGEGKELFDDCIFTSVKTDYKDIVTLPEVVYAGPYIVPAEFPELMAMMTNRLYVRYSDSVSSLSDYLKTFGVLVLGYNSNLGVYIIACTKDSKGTPADIALELYESNKFSLVEIEFPYTGF